MTLVAGGLLLIVPTLAYSIRAVRQGRYELHRKIQLTLAVILAVAVTIFELDVRLRGWRHLAEPSPYFGTWLFPVLYVHLVFAVATTLLWAVATWHGVKRMGRPARAGPHSRRHRLIGRATAIATVATTLTGWTFYYLAFIA